MVDRAAIFTDLTRRNALRREAELPLLDIQTEFNHAVEVALWNEGLEVYADDIARAIDETWADLRQRYGADFPQSVGGRWLVHFEGTKRVHALLADRGVYRPVSRYSVKYGEDNNCTVRRHPFTG